MTEGKIYYMKKTGILVLLSLLILSGCTSKNTLSDVSVVSYISLTDCYDTSSVRVRSFAENLDEYYYKNSSWHLTCSDDNGRFGLYTRHRGQVYQGYDDQSSMMLFIKSDDVYYSYDSFVDDYTETSDDCQFVELDFVINLVEMLCQEYTCVYQGTNMDRFVCKNNDEDIIEVYYDDEYKEMRLISDTGIIDCRKCGEITVSIIDGVNINDIGVFSLIDNISDLQSGDKE